MPIYTAMIVPGKSRFILPRNSMLNISRGSFSGQFSPFNTSQCFLQLHSLRTIYQTPLNNNILDIRTHQQPHKTWGLRENQTVNLESQRTYASRKYTRQERINQARYTAQVNLDKLDEEYNLFHDKVTKVVDLGSVPGTWLRHTRNRLSQIHGVKPEELYTKCTVIGSDMLFCQPPRGTFFTQGNIYSQNTHDQVESLLKESAYRLSTMKKGPRPDVSYIQKELNEIQLEESVESITETMSKASLEENQKNAFFTSPSVYQADLVLSDMGAVPLQESGFHNNTLSKPYIRSSQNKMLRQPWDNPQKASIDMAEAALLLCGKVLAKGGAFIVRLSSVDLSDPELFLLETRLSRVFHRVSRWSDNGRTWSDQPVQQNMFMVCQDKKGDWIDKYEVFGVPKDGVHGQ